MKTFFQKLVSAIPLRPNIAAIFALILGTLGLFLPWVYLYIALKDSSGVTSHIVIPRTHFFGVIDTWTCLPIKNLISLPPIWLTEADSIWNGMFRMLPMFIGHYYFLKFESKKSSNAEFALWALFLFGFIGLSVWLAPEPIICGDDWQLTIYNYSISWFPVFVTFISILLGVYAYQKGKIEKIENLTY
ncbi:MAG: hypothetical protein C4583_00430 [Anaerolineaceae bacterium]|nr:MAG: hypothetical protein C4583_00430 [Anaerolineaceae bacterium]